MDERTYLQMSEEEIKGLMVEMFNEGLKNKGTSISYEELAESVKENLEDVHDTFLNAFAKDS